MGLRSVYTSANAIVASSKPGSRWIRMRVYNLVVVQRKERTVVAVKNPTINGALLWSPPGGGGPSG